MTAHPDPAFPNLHGRPAVGWLNDPNGLARVDGRWHVFFQYNPDEPLHRRVHWGHASSDDLVSWRQEPVALRPRPGRPDAHGCWSGSVTVDRGIPTAVYSGVVDDDGASSVVLARSDRTMRTWHADAEPVLDDLVDDLTSDVRDPFIFTAFGRRYAVLGAGHRRGSAWLPLYLCDDLEDWQPRGSLLDGDNEVATAIAPANIWECPNLVRMGDDWLLVVSTITNEPDGVELRVRWMLGALEDRPEGPRFRPRTGGALDDGPCFYAPQLLVDEQRVLVWAWAPELGRQQRVLDGVGWAGCLTFPRELYRLGDGVGIRPAPELARLRREELLLEPGTPINDRSFEVELPVNSRVQLSLVGVETGDRTARSHVGTWDIVGDPVTTPRLLVDGSMVEVFDGGPRSFTTRAYPSSSSAWMLEVSSSEEADGAHLPAWRLDRPG